MAKPLSLDVKGVRVPRSLELYGEEETVADAWGRILIMGPSKGGKAQPITEPVLTPDGWRAIGELSIGSEVIGSDGTAKTVKGVYPQGVKDVFRVVTDDGASTRCCNEHLWLTMTRNERDRSRYIRRGPHATRERIPTGDPGTGSVKSLDEIRSTLAQGHFVPCTKPVQFRADEPLSISPYILGLLLGDGYLPRDYAPNFCSDDMVLHEEVRAYVESIGDGWREEDSHGLRTMTTRVRGPGDRQASRLKTQLGDLKLIGCRSHEKFVPKQYMRASPEDRLALLQGLCDTDGSLRRNSCTSCEFCTTSPQLANDVVELVQQLGGRASCGIKRFEDYRDAYRIIISFADGTCPFRLHRKAGDWRSSRRTLNRRIVQVEPNGREECVCIEVEDQLYVTRGAIVTHNTTACLKTSPKPIFVINCDGPSALVGARNQGASGYRAVDVTNGQQWVDAVQLALRLAQAGEAQTVIIDPISTLSDSIVYDVESFKEGHELWKEVLDLLSGGMRELKANLEAHLILTAHPIPNEDGLLGILPGVAGQSKWKIPAMMHDWIWLDVDTKKDPVERNFLIGPQKSWNHGARNAKRSIAIEADVTELLKELGIEP